jgi:hypothetical protein
MSLIKDIQEKNFAGLKDYFGDRISSIVVDKINIKKVEFLNKVRGITEAKKPMKDEDPDKDKKVVADPDKDGDADKDKAKDTDKDFAGKDKSKDK